MSATIPAPTQFRYNDAHPGMKRPCMDVSKRQTDDRKHRNLNMRVTQQEAHKSRYPALSHYLNLSMNYGYKLLE
jgi:hypothetical protein